MRLEDILHLRSALIEELTSLEWPIFGFEGKGGEGGNSGGKSGSGSSESEDEEDDDHEGDEDDEDEDEDSSKSSKSGKKGGKQEEDDEDGAAGLRSALKKERLARREAQRGLKKLQGEFDTFKTQQTKGQEEEEQAKTKAQAEAATSKLEKVAAGFAKNAVDTALVRALSSPKAPKFQDPDDVLRLIDRDDIDVDQDDDDPSKVSVDSNDVRQALKELAKRKPHLLIKGEGEGEGGEGDGGSGKGGSKTGKFGGGAGKDKGAARREELLKKYPALGRR